MTILLQAMLFERYGPRLSIEQLSEMLGMAKGTIYNQISAGSFPVKTYVDGGKRWADARDVAQHFDRMRDSATAGAGLPA